MHLTDHVSDVQLNEYLDNETNARAQIEAHLSACDDCAARLSDLKILFTEIESLPELAVSKNFASRFTFQPSLTPHLPRWLTLTLTLQAALALIALIVSIPFITTYVPQIDFNSLTSPLFEIQSLWNTWLDSLSTLVLSLVEGLNFQPSTFNLPTLPIIEMSSLLLSLAGIFVLWIFGNGLLLRNQIR